MKSNKSFLNLLLLFVLIGSTAIAQNNQPNPQKGVNVFPDNAALQYSGRIDYSNPKQPIFYWAGTAIKTQFTGTTLGVCLFNPKGDNFYNVFIDGTPYLIKCGKGDSLYNVASKLSSGIHALQITRRTDPTSALNKFEGLAIDKNATVTKPAPAPKLKFEIYGNSITSGVGILDEGGKNNNDPNTWDNNSAYGAITSRNLNAEYRCISRSGIGFIISWFPLIMPEMYDRLNPADPNSKWDFSKWTPDIVVINLGQNDSWLISRLKPVPQEPEIIQRYCDFVSLIRAKYPKAAIFCALGSMDATKVGSPWPGYIRTAVKKLKDEKSDKNIYAMMFPFTNKQAHPTISDHKQMADSLTAFIKQTLNLK